MAESVIISLQTWSGGVKPILGIIVVDESSNLFNGFLSHFQNDWSEDVICWFVVDGKHLVFSSGYIGGSMWGLGKSSETPSWLVFCSEVRLQCYWRVPWILHKNGSVLCRGRVQYLQPT